MILSCICLFAGDVKPGFISQSFFGICNREAAASELLSAVRDFELVVSDLTN